MRRIFVALALLLVPDIASAQTPADKPAPIDGPRAADRAAGFLNPSPAELEAIEREKSRNEEEFKPLLEASGLQAKASWRLLGADVWVAGDSHRMAAIYIRVDSNNRAQILLTTLLVAKDLVDSNRLESVHIRAMGRWYTPDITLGENETAYVLFTRFKDYDDWTVRVGPRIPTENELLVARTRRRLYPPRRNEIVIMEGLAPLLYRQQLEQKLAEATHLSLSEVRASLGGYRPYTAVRICVSLRRYPGGYSCYPDELPVDLAAIHRPLNFPNAVRVMDEMCKGKRTVTYYHIEHECKFGMPY
jgi:hypothetical protein